MKQCRRAPKQNDKERKRQGRTWRAKLVEDTLGDPGENAGHRIDPGFGILIEKIDHFHAVVEKLAAQEPIRQEDLPHNVDQVESLADEESQRPSVVIVQIPHEIIGQNVFLLGSILRLLPQREHVQTCPIPTRSIKQRQQQSTRTKTSSPSATKGATIISLQLSIVILQHFPRIAERDRKRPVNKHINKIQQN